MKSIRPTTKWLLLGSILVIAIWLRFWRLDQLFHWTLDEEYWSYVAYNVATGYHLPLIGGPIGGTGVYLGPLFVWFMGFIFWVIRSNPWWLAAFVSSTGVVSTLSLYLVAKRWYSVQVALVASALYATSTLAVIYDRKYWNASLAPILSILSIHLVYKLGKRPTYPLVILLGAVVTLAINAHMTGLVLVIFGLLGLCLQRVNWRYLLVYLGTIAVLHIPLVAFDIRHNFINTQALVALFGPDQDPKDSLETYQSHQVSVGPLIGHTFGRLLYTPATDIADELTLCRAMAQSRSRPPIAYLVLGSLVGVYGLYRLWIGDFAAILLLINVVLVGAYGWVSPENFYPGQLSEYYLLPSFGAFFILTGQLIIHVHKRLPLVAISLVVFLLIINTQTGLNLKHSHSYASKFETVTAAISNLGDRPFTLGVTGHECQIYGYRYLFSYFDREPVASYLDPTFGWLYQELMSSIEPEVGVVIDADSATITYETITQTP